MLVPAPQMRCTPHLIPVELKFEQLGYSNLQGLSDSAKARIPCTFGGPSYLFEKIRAKRICCPPKITIRLSDKLGNQMQVPDRLKELGELSELPVDVHLFKMCLVQAVGISFVLWSRPL